MKTGTDATHKGLYYSECCDCEVTLNKGDSFPRCPKCSALTIWENVEDSTPKAA